MFVPGLILSRGTRPPMTRRGVQRLRSTWSCTCRCKSMPSDEMSKIGPFYKLMWRFLYLRCMPNAEYEVSYTRRYTGGNEACIIAMKDWSECEMFKTFPRVIATVDPEEEAKFRNADLDFSIIYSTGKNVLLVFASCALYECKLNCNPCRFLANS